MAQKVFTKKQAIAVAKEVMSRGERGSKPVTKVGPSPVSRPLPPPPALATSGPPEKEHRKADDLPLVSVFNKADMRHSIDLMKEDVALQLAQDETKTRREEIKTTLADIARRNNVPGMRHGRYCTYYGGDNVTSWRLNQAMLLENGVTPDQIKASMKETKGHVELRVVDLEKPRKGKGGEGGGED